VRKVFFTSDTHFGHRNIIRYCNRPFESVSEMGRELIRRWNAVVREEDEVWHLGDFSLSADVERVRSWFGQLNGAYINLLALYDHHDGYWLRELHKGAMYQFGPVFPWYTRSGGVVVLYPPIVTGVYEEVTLALSHFPMRDWDRKRHGALHLHGHSHGRVRSLKHALDVGVDTPLANYAPISLERILEILEAK